MTTPDAPAPLVRPRPARTALLISGLTIGVVITALVSVGSGQLSISPLEVLSILLGSVGIDLGIVTEHPNAEAALWTIRLPRVVMSLVIGAALAVAGMLMQAIFGNPLAEPGVVGVSSGAALGACSAIVFGLSFFGEWTTAVLAFGAGLITTLVVYVFSRSRGKTEVVTLILTGIAVNAFCGAGLAFLTFIGDTAAREQIVFWQLGSLNGSRWVQVAVVVPCVLIGVAASFVLVRRLDLLALGEKSARHLGVNVEALRIVAIVLVALLVGAAVAFAGIIGFVGLVVPHLMRMIIGPAHLPLLVTSTLGGALLLMLADLFARTAITYADLPIGMLTSLVGGPFFFWLLRRTRKRSGGWA
ncbi:iron ABC transporter permease [Glaciihabitans arcticus]|uniref:Iron ABC transporter permease n=2 Tax=Glaciihabitans arcticus TaxID=2668039 RepID=A0A4Q9GU73_9MICO|nr:iron ABC transporter permease [Glaciihabitans arcticus]TBN58632.1 iron ABC transporter permease [Glaciihabitans arcticus]